MVVFDICQGAIQGGGNGEIPNASVCLFFVHMVFPVMVTGGGVGEATSAFVLFEIVLFKGACGRGMVRPPFSPHSQR